MFNQLSTLSLCLLLLTGVTLPRHPHPDTLIPTLSQNGDVSNDNDQPIVPPN